MIFAVFGGDDRIVRLCGLLRADGHSVRPYALEGKLPCTANPEEALRGADAVILPLPCEAGGGLNAPYSAEKHAFPALLASAPPGMPVLAGKAPEALRSVCRRQKLALHDYFLREDFTLRNAELTAEGAVELLLQGSETSLRGSRVLIVGFGRIGRLLAVKLRALGADVTVAARKSEDRVLAECLGCRALPLPLPGSGHWDAVVNTVPARIFGAAEMEELGGARMVELASPPYGFDFDEAAAAGKQIELASGLPGKTAPAAAAAAVRDAIYEIMEE